MTKIPKLYTSSEKIAEIWRKEYPGVEIVMTERLKIAYIHNSIRDILEDLIVCQDCGGYVSDHNGIQGDCNYESGTEIVDKAEQSINAYILGEVEAIIGDDEPVEMEYIRTNTGEILGPMTDDIVTPQLNRLRQELRNKANERWGK